MYAYAPLTAPQFKTTDVEVREVYVRLTGTGQFVGVVNIDILHALFSELPT